MQTDKAELFWSAWKLLAGQRDEPVAEHRFHPTRKWRFDFAWPDAKVAVEVDGGQWAFRGGRHATDADREKLNEAAAMGWRVFRFSPRQLKNEPDRCVMLVKSGLGHES